MLNVTPLPSSPRVLVVDDDRAVRDAFQLTLEIEGYEVVVAEHGEDALAKIKEAAPAVILLDVRMPVMDGPTFAQTYHKWPGPHAPIIVITATTDSKGM